MVRSVSLSAVLLLCGALLPLVATQTLSPSNNFSSPYPTGSDQIQLSPPFSRSGLQSPRFNLVNLTANAFTQLSAQQGLNGYIQRNIVFVAPNTTESASQFNQSTIAILPCDQGSGYLTAVQILGDVIAASVPAVILYSSVDNWCNLETGGNIPSTTLIYSASKSTDWQQLQQISNSSFGQSQAWYIGRESLLNNLTMSGTNGNGDTGDGNNGGGNQSTASPSTAVAMIILYSITGVITALFLVIIVTGAVRAHRHPERYGPRNVLGRPRQSRAKGLARAMLETLPIVKFGEREDDRVKPTDVEMANTKSVVSADGDESEAHEGDVGGRSAADNGSTADITEAAGAQVEEPASKDEDAPGCSICTEDFERGQDVRVLPCNHSFHPACIDPWLLNVSGTCPLCRIDLRPANEQNADRSAADNTLPPPLEVDAVDASGAAVQNDRSSRRLSSSRWDLVNPLLMARATREERLAALRNLRASRRQSTADEAETRRRRRLTARLGETFGVRTRPRGASPTTTAEGAVSPEAAASSSSVQNDVEPGAVRSIAEESIAEEPLPTQDSASSQPAEPSGATAAENTTAPEPSASASSQPAEPSGASAAENTSAPEPSASVSNPAPSGSGTQH